MQRNISDIKENLSNAKESGTKCTLLVGAGCSVKAGIPLASGFVEIIKKKYENAYNRAKEKTYPACMAELSDGPRRDLIAKYVDNAKINWAHICIALLVHEGYIDRIFTTNFDPLLIKACALLNEFPAVYDFAVSQLFKPADVADKAIFHLHGQRDGFVLLNTEEECNKLSNHLKPVFQDSVQSRMWIVIGYSGDNDPVFDHLAEINRFGYGLYWIGYKDDEPSEHLRERLLVKDKDAHFVKGYDADSFFIELTRELDIFPPDFIGRPFTHLNNCFEMTTPFKLFNEEPEGDVTHNSREIIKKCIDEYETNLSPIQKANDLLLKGDYDGVVKMQSSYNKTYLFSWDEIPGNDNDKLIEFLKQKIGIDWVKTAEIEKTDNDNTIKVATDISLNLNQEKTEVIFKIDDSRIDKFTAEIENGKLNIYNKTTSSKFANVLSWGYIGQGKKQSDLAMTKEGDEAEKLFSLAFEKYEAAFKIKPDRYEALNIWGLVLSKLAMTKEGDEAESLLYKAKEKILQANDIKKGSGAYYLACISALHNDEAACREWLNLAYELKTLPELENLNSDFDLDSVRDTNWFKEIIANVINQV